MRLLATSGMLAFGVCGRTGQYCYLPYLSHRHVPNEFVPLSLVKGRPAETSRPADATSKYTPSKCYLIPCRDTKKYLFFNACLLAIICGLCLWTLDLRAPLSPFFNVGLHCGLLEAKWGDLFWKLPATVRQMSLGGWHNVIYTDEKLGET